MDATLILKNVGELSASFAADRKERQKRRGLVPGDFAALRDAGFLLTGVPAEEGGIWQDLRRSARPVCEILRVLAHGDSSVALVCSMHPSVLIFWLATPEAPAPFRQAWAAQRSRIFQTAREGSWWGTITSEPGSGGDMAKTKATARPVDGEGGYKISGQKQFGSGSGITSYMVTTALPEGEASPDLFFMDMKNVPWDGNAGVTLTAPWDGHGMIATQSHAFAFADFPGKRSAAPGSLMHRMEATGGFIQCAFSSVIVGVVETAIETARLQISRRREELRPFERIEWTRAEMEGWLILQAYEGMLRAVEEGKEGRRRAAQGKTAIAELAVSVMDRLCRALGGGTFSRSSPFGYWYEDVRALGFLRPPWGLVYDNLFDWSCAEPV
ncbi:MAG: acyl-CoA/acyl-ACP dehydrogenase [Fibrobacterota bacterium]|nr:acyl-CoA/acyl-ACP dehydrogenase [Fibrobacterota bacterium]